MNILNKPTTNLEQGIQWAKSKKATQLFMDLIPKFYEIATREGVDPTLVLVQCAKETGYCRFGGVLDASFKNTCGLKTSKGGGCTDPDAHKRFNTWEEGILAQVQHLALYAGKSGYPLSNPVDPRHFSYLHGKCKTVVSLSGNWAGATYGQDLVKMMNDVINTKVEVSEVDRLTKIIKEKEAKITELENKLMQINTISKL